MALLKFVVVKKRTAGKFDKFARNENHTPAPPHLKRVKLFVLTLSPNVPARNIYANCILDPDKQLHHLTTEKEKKPFLGRYDSDRYRGECGEIMKLFNLQ